MEQTAQAAQSPQSPQNPANRLTPDEIRSQTREYGAEMDRFGVAIGGLNTTILNVADSFERVTDRVEIACTRLENTLVLINGRIGGHHGAIPRANDWEHRGRGSARHHDPEHWGYSGIDTARDHVEWGRLAGMVEGNVTDLKSVMLRSESAFSRLIQRLEAVVSQISSRMAA